MLFICDLNNHPLNANQRIYEVRAGSQLNYQVLGRFYCQSNSTIKVLLEKAAHSVLIYSTALALNQPELIPDEPDVIINRTALTINNVSEYYSKKGVQSYSVNRLIDDKEVNFLECIGNFEHNCENGAESCLLKASTSIDSALLNSDYVSIINNNLT